ncbi:MAG TPA: hypothetical protein VJ022_11100 [Anaerolineales bacterium]|nr:hypothetical protein [Anaerolineales bacterium]HLE89570.1 hypothetical protein [Anaerolineales bacterium]
MAEEKTPEGLKQFFGTIGELGKYAATILAYVVAIAGVSPEYPQLVSVLTVVITTAAVWVWRWPHLSQKHPPPSDKELLIVGESRPKEILSQTNRFWEPFRSSSRHSFVLTLFRRRVEISVMLALAAFSIWFSASKSQKVYEEVSGLECSYASQNNAPRVVIAEFYIATGSDTAFEANMFSSMRDQFDQAITVCRYSQEIEDGKDAEELGRNRPGTIVVWGVSDQDYFQINITPINWPGLELNWRASPENSKELRAWAIEYVSQIIIIEVSFDNGDIGSEIRHLNVAINNASEQNWAEDDLKQLAPAYFLAGLLFEEAGDPSGALEAYTKTIAMDSNYEVALLNRGNLFYWSFNDTASAMADFNELIERNSDFAADAFASRASIQPEWENEKSDLIHAIKINPGEQYYYHLLGLQALAEGEIDTAMHAYRDLLDHLDSGTRDEFITDLKHLALEDPSLQTSVEEIIDLLQEANLR